MVTGPLEWWSDGQQQRGPREPRTALQSFAVDGADRLWMLTRVADDDWRSVAQQGPEPGILPSQQDQYRDARLDVFDLRNRRHIGSRRWDSPFGVALTESAGVVYVSSVEWDSEDWLQVRLYSLDDDAPTGR